MAFSGNDTYLHLERSLDRYLGLPLLLASRLLTGLFTKINSRPATRRQRVLLIKFHGIGNLIMLLPAVRLVRKRYPDAELHFLTFDTNRETLKLMEGIDQCYFLERGGLWSLAVSTLRFLAHCPRNIYDIAVDFEQFAYFSSILSVLASPSGMRIGFDNPSHRRASAYTVPVTYMETEHMSAIFLKLVEALGVKIPARIPSGLQVDSSARTDALGILDSLGIRTEDTLVLIHPGSSENLMQRRWPPYRFAALADVLITDHGAKVVFTGTTKERVLIRDILDNMKNDALHLTDPLTLRAFTALTAVSELVVANDTAAVHIADAVGTPVVGLYGPNTPFLYGPRDMGRHLIFYKQLPCSPCLRNTSRKISSCKSPVCMEEITVREIAAGIRSRYFDGTGHLLPVFKRHRALDKSPEQQLTVA